MWFPLGVHNKSLPSLQMRNVELGYKVREGYDQKSSYSKANGIVTAFFPSLWLVPPPSRSVSTTHLLSFTSQPALHLPLTLSKISCWYSNILIVAFHVTNYLLHVGEAHSGMETQGCLRSPWKPAADSRVPSKTLPLDRTGCSFLPWWPY